MQAITLQTALRQSRDLLLDLIFPRRCIGCGAEGEFLCRSCLNLLPRLTPPYCECCAVPFSGGRLCPNCLNSPPAINGVRSLFLHRGMARDAVHHLKYRNLKALARPLAKLMAEYLEPNPLPVDLILAVPLHSKRVRQRGYNQSDLLAQELSRLIDLPTASGSLVRLRNTPSQVSLGAEARRSNVQGAFRCKNQVFQSKGVLLVDDVCTTGATLNACAVALKEAGAASVWGLTFSREQQGHQGENPPETP
ncbi:ComF family protein [Dehalococcoidia bacterium]|nr:ComF family protein [Dehalococcoidia bacterium]